MRFKSTDGLLAILLVLTFVSAGPAQAHGRHGHARVGIYVGAPLVVPGPYIYPGYGYYGPGPYYGYPPVVVPVPAAPTTYVEQAPVAGSAAQVPGQYWYWCSEPQGYYPSVRECPGGWTPVAPQPSQGPRQ